MSGAYKVARKTAQILRECSAQEIASLFHVHGVKPKTEYFFFFPDGDPSMEPCGCCGVGVAALEAVTLVLGDNFGNPRDRAASLALKHADIRAFARGFDGEKSIDETEQAMYDKGVEVYRVATQTKEQA